MVHSQLEQTVIISRITSTPHPHSENCSFCMFSLFHFSSIFQGGSVDPICPYVRTPMPQVAAAGAESAVYTDRRCRCSGRRRRRREARLESGRTPIRCLASCGRPRRRAAGGTAPPRWLRRRHGMRSPSSSSCDAVCRRPSGRASWSRRSSSCTTSRCNINNT